MYVWLKERLSILRAAQNRPWVKFVWYLFAIIGLWDTVGSQLVPESWGEKWPRIYELAMSLSGLLPWSGWVIIGLSLALFFTLEFSIRQNLRQQSRDASMAVGEVAAAIPYEEWRNLDEIDLPTAAAIWSGTRDENDVNRHLRFRELKQAVREGKLRSCSRVGGKVNRFTTVKPDELATYFQIRSVDENVSTFIDFEPRGKILSSNNITSFTDNGINDFTIHFSRSFKNSNIACIPLGITSRKFSVKEVSDSYVRIKFEELEPNRISMKFEEA